MLGKDPTLADAMDIMQGHFQTLDFEKPSVLNPELSALTAWEIVWKKLLELVQADLQNHEDPTKTRVSPWLFKRILQVCHNSFAPDDKPPTPADVLDILEPDDKPKPGPYDRMFID